MDTPLISVILATYNGSKYLSEAIDSVLAQDYQNIELIIIDDASTDIHVSEQIQQYQIQDARIRSFRNEKNMERSWSKNFWVRQAKGPYIAFIDDDDIWERTKLSKQIDVLEQNPHIGIVGSFASFVEENWTPISTTNHLATTEHNVYEKILLSNQFVQSAVLIRKSIFLEAGGFPIFNLCEDYDLWLRVLKTTKGINVPEPLLRYRVRQMSTTAKNTYRMKWITIKLILKYWSDFPHGAKSLVFKIITFPFSTSFLLRIWNWVFRKNRQI